MNPDNPYAAPAAPLVEPSAPGAILRWSVTQLRVLAALSLAELACTLLMIVTGLALDPLRHPSVVSLGHWLGPMVSLLGCYLLLRLRLFVEARFGASGLAWPVWLAIAASLLVTGLESLLGDRMVLRSGWPLWLYFATVALYGLATAWFGWRLLRVRDVYSAVRVLAWLALIGGAMLASVVLVLPALVPLLGLQLAMAVVFLRGASERRRAAG